MKRSPQSSPPNFFMRLSPQKLLLSQCLILGLRGITLGAAAWTLSMSLAMHKKKTNIFNLKKKERRLFIIGNVITTTLLFASGLVPMPPLDIIEFYFIRRSPTTPRIQLTSDLLARPHQPYLEKMQATPIIYQYDRNDHDRRKRQYVFESEWHSFISISIAFIQVLIILFVVKLNKDEIFEHYSNTVLLVQIVILICIILMLVGRNISALMLCLYDQYEAVNTVKGTGFCNIIDMKHFVKERNLNY